MSGERSVKARCLPFSQIPHTTKLFLDLLSYAPDVRQFYPRSANISEWLKEEAASLRYDSSRRQQVSSILERQNKSWDASPQTLANLERFRNGAAAVVTGQQVGLFGGPMFSIYKALSAVKLAEQATAAGVDSVPIFWLATYDHDLAEVNHVAMPGADGALETLTTSSHDIAGAPVSAVRLGDEILPVIERAAALLGDTDATRILRESYRPGETLGTAFARFYTRLFAEWGVIILDASDGELHTIAQPLYRAAVERAEEIVNVLAERGAALEGAGYHQQVKVTPSSVLLFTLQNGARSSIHRKGSGDAAQFQIGGEGGEKLSQAELLSRIESHPETFSPNVLLRPIVQDYLLPTLAYVGGAAEAAYFSQAGALYELLSGRVTPIIPRFSATLVDAKIQRVFEKFEISMLDVIAGPESLRSLLAARSMPHDLQSAFDRTKKSLELDLVALTQKLAKLDQTLVDAAQTAASKMQYQLERLYTQAARAELQKGELIGRKAELLSQTLFPEKALQERGIAGLYFVARYGTDLLHQIYDAIQPDCHDHQILEL
jgi:bacillithiol biosynthesis cysteine-adding enzyme BshC